MKYVVTLKDKTYEVEVENGEAMIRDEYEAKAPVAAAPAAVAAPAADAAPAAAAAPVAAGEGTPVTAPLPGSVLSIACTQGAAVKAGDTLLVIEAMKMENPITAPSDGTVKQILVAKGQMVATGDTLVLI